MKWLESNLVVAFWAFIFGEVIGYIGGALEKMAYNPMQLGLFTVLVALIAVNGISFLARDDVKQPSAK